MELGARDSTNPETEKNFSSGGTARTDIASILKAASQRQEFNVVEIKL
jgi:hypothetical protein